MTMLDATLMTIPSTDNELASMMFVCPYCQASILNAHAVRCPCGRCPVCGVGLVDDQQPHVCRGDRGAVERRWGVSAKRQAHVRRVIELRRTRVPARICLGLVGILIGYIAGDAALNAMRISTGWLISAAPIATGIFLGAAFYWGFWPPLAVGAEEESGR